MAGQVRAYKTKGGRRWRIDYELPPEAGSGRRRRTTRRGFTTRRAAERALRDVLGAIDDGTHVDRSTQTFERYLLDDWLPAKQPRGGGGRQTRGQLGIQTWTTYRQQLTYSVIPRLGRIPLQQLAASDITALYDALEREGGRSGEGLSPKSLANLHAIIHKALKDAVRWGRISRNPADLVDSPRTHRTRSNVWDLDQLRRFVDHVRDERLYAMWLLFATTGMRRGEVLGLAWEDVDLAAGSLRVTWTLGHVQGLITWKPLPKTRAGERTLALDPATVEALRVWRKTQAAERLLCGPTWSELGEDGRGLSRPHVVFTWPDGRLLDPNRVTRWFRLTCEAAGLPIIRLHDVRHTYATAALASAAGWHEVKVLSQRLGHASIGITLDTYAHALPAADAEQAHTLARVILGRPAEI